MMRKATDVHTKAEAIESMTDLLDLLDKAVPADDWDRLRKMRDLRHYVEMWKDELRAGRGYRGSLLQDTA
jgi:hypothetical protein